MTNPGESEKKFTGWFEEGRPKHDHNHNFPKKFCFIDLLMDLFRGAVYDHGGVPENSPLALMGRFASLMGRFLTLMGRLP